MEWVNQFYRQQNEWFAAVYGGDVQAHHQENAALVQEAAGGLPGRVLDLGAGGGQNAAATADLGYEVTAVELVAELADHGRQLAAVARTGALIIMQGDFYQLAFDAPFDVITYWDGFGVGTDEDQRRLLGRMAGWLKPDGVALVEIYAPSYWQNAAGREMNFGAVSRRYGFDGAGRRMLDSWWPNGREEETVTQSLRCYSVSELETLLQGTGLKLAWAKSRGAYYPEKRAFVKDVPLEEAMQWLAKLVRV